MDWLYLIKDGVFSFFFNDIDDCLIMVNFKNWKVVFDDFEVEVEKVF